MSLRPHRAGHLLDGALGNARDFWRAAPPRERHQTLFTVGLVLIIGALIALSLLG